MSWSPSLPSPTESSPMASISHSPPCKGILRKRQHVLDVNQVTTSLQALKVDGKGRACCSKSVKFSDNVDEHTADDWDRSSCAVACPTYRDILELKQIQLELLPDRRGIIRDQYEFDFDCEGDVDRSSRSGGARPRYLKRVPLELCPILPAAPASTPDDSARSSPMQSPLHTPPRSLSPARSPPLQKPQPKPLMTFLPILPPSAPPSTESTPNLLTPPQTPDPSPLQNHETPTVPVSRTTSSPSPSSSSPADKLPSTPAPTPSIFTSKECASNAKQHFNLLPIVPCTAPLISSSPSPPVSRSPIHLRGMSCAAASNRPIVGSAMTPRRSTELSPSSSMFPPPFTIAYKAHATTI